MYIVICPHCDNLIEILQLNCQIFRHGVYKKDYKQMNPHAPKNVCDNVVEKGLIYGCGKPFRVIKKEHASEAVICDYI
mgnify:CR=1 FL=1